MRSWKWVLAAGMMVLALGARSVGAAEEGKKRKEPAVRVGVFDSRALAVVYCRTPEFNQKIKKLMEEHKKAKEAGDADKAKDLEAQGKAQQERLHLQGFSGASVEEILESIKDKLPQIAKEAGVDVIVSKWQISYQAPSAKLVDVTEAMLRPFNPDEKALRVVKDLMGKPLIPAEQVRRHKH